jgi:lipoyl(octanoyl) transferase
MRLRVIADPPRTAVWNMAADLHLLDACVRSRDATLRFYSWERPTVSLGCMQKPSEALDLSALAAAGGEWVRRPTGGRAVLHAGDLTYSVCFANTTGAMGATVQESYAVIAAGLLAGLRRAGVKADSHDSPLDTASARRETKLPCFLAPNRDEIMVGGRKLIGSAQKRTSCGLLQHGSIPLTAAFRDLPDYTNVSLEERRAQRRLLERKCVCIGEVAPTLPKAELLEHLTRGFAETLGIRLVRLGWSTDELATIAARAAAPEFIAGHTAIA